MLLDEAGTQDACGASHGKCSGLCCFRGIPHLCNHVKQHELAILRWLRKKAFDILNRRALGHRCLDLFLKTPCLLMALAVLTRAMYSRA